jgi:WD40 repeat protein
MGDFSLDEIATGRNVSRNLGLPNVTKTAFSRDGKRFCAASFLGYAQVWETETFGPVATVGDRSVPYYSANFSPDGIQLITGSGETAVITLFDLATQLELIHLEGTSSRQYSGGQFSLDGNVLAAGCSSGELYLWRAPSWDEIEAADKREAKALIENQPAQILDAK